MSVLNDVNDKLKEVMDLVHVLPAGYQYKVRELCSCIETVVSMHDDIQRGIIPEIFSDPEEVKITSTLKLPETYNLDLE